MIFHRALLREFASLAGAVFMTLFAIALTTRLIRLLGQAAGGQIPTDAVIAFLGFFALGALPVLLSLTMFISVLLTLTRSWRDSEMVIWFGSGLSLTAWLKPVMLFALPQIAVIAALSLVHLAVGGADGRAVRDASSRRATTFRASARACSARPRTRSACSSSNRCRATRRRCRTCSSSSVQQQKSGVSMSRSGPHRDRAERRPLHRARARPALRGRARRRAVPGHGVRALRRAHRDRARARSRSSSQKSMTTCAAARQPDPGQPRRAAVARRHSGVGR